MPIITINTIEGLLTKEKKQEIHKKITDVMVEVEGDGNEAFRNFVIINIIEEDHENFSMGGIQSSPELMEKLFKR